jgi:pentatricopeptide repeat protein
MLKMLRERGLRADPEAFECLIDACGRCGDTERATQLLGRMHEDGIVADGVVYSSLVAAFSAAENNWKRVTGEFQEDLPGPSFAFNCVAFIYHSILQGYYLFRMGQWGIYGHGLEYPQSLQTIIY